MFRGAFMVNFEIDYKAIGKRIRFFRKQQKKY